MSDESKRVQKESKSFAEFHGKLGAFLEGRAMLQSIASTAGGEYLTRIHAAKTGMERIYSLLANRSIAEAQTESSEVGALLGDILDYFAIVKYIISELKESDDPLKSELQSRRKEFGRLVKDHKCLNEIIQKWDSYQTREDEERMGNAIAVLKRTISENMIRQL